MYAEHPELFPKAREAFKHFAVQGVRLKTTVGNQFPYVPFICWSKQAEWSGGVAFLVFFVALNYFFFFSFFLFHMSVVDSPDNVHRAAYSQHERTHQPHA